MRALKSAGCGHVHCTQVALAVVGNASAGINLLALCFSFSSESRKSRHALPNMKFKILKVRVGAAVEQTQVFRSALLIFSVRWQCHRSWEHLHGIHFLSYSGLNQTLYFTTETAESSETSGSKFRDGNRIVLIKRCWLPFCNLKKNILINIKVDYIFLTQTIIA